MSSFFMRFRPMTEAANWQFRDPDTHFLYSSATKKELIDYIVSYRSQNELEPIDFLSATIDNYVCQLPENKGMCERYPLKRGIIQYLKGGLNLVKQAFTGSFVEQEEADRRGEICVTCPNNVFPEDKSKFMSWSDSVAAQSIGQLKSSRHDYLGNCAGCTCLLKAKVWLMPPFKLSKKEAHQMRSVKAECWQLPENQQKDRIDV